MKSKIISVSLIGIGFFVGVSALSVLADWTAPTSTPPACPAGSPGCDAPINVSGTAQTKLGSLTVNSNLINSIGLTVGNAIKIVDGNQGVGKVLTSDANGVGTWQSGLLPAPSYDSGWVSMSDATRSSSVWDQVFEKTLTHNLGTTNTLVYAEGRNLKHSGSGIGNIFSGIEDSSSDNKWGITWTSKNDTSIKVVIGDNEKAESPSAQIRIQKWKIKP